MAVTTFRTCKKCNQEFPETEEYFRLKPAKGKLYMQHSCRECEKVKAKNYARLYRNGNREKVKKYERDRARKIRNENPEYLRRHQRNWYKNNKIKAIEWANDHTNDLSDNYVCAKLGMSVNDCPKELIEAKRIVLKIKREIKNLQGS